MKNKIKQILTLAEIDFKVNDRIYAVDGLTIEIAIVKEITINISENNLITVEVYLKDTENTEWGDCIDPSLISKDKDQILAILKERL